MNLDALKKKALSLPLQPGVYLMKDKSGDVIYVGKAKKLKNRVGQYFQASASHSGKTRQMVSQICDFDTISAGSEFEALVLECSLIKRHQPRYNILLKDDKGYPFIRLDLRKEYPTMEMVGRVQEDGAHYFGPFGGRYITQQVMDAIRVALKLPGCKRKFPKDFGKGRPCLNYHIGNCEGWCIGQNTQDVYADRIHQAVQLLKGDYKTVSNALKKQISVAAEELRFEEAALLRDRWKAVEALGQKQLVTAGSSQQTDVIGYCDNGTKACFAVLHFADGSLIDKEYEILPSNEDAGEAVSSLVKQYYLRRGFAPKEILLPMEAEDMDLFSRLLQESYGRKTVLRVPQRGVGVKMLRLAEENAKQEAERITTLEEKNMATLAALGKLMGLATAPKRLESYDISNTAGTDIVASMVVFCDGKPKKSEYRKFSIRDLQGQDDYASMEQVIRRRMERYLIADPKFSTLPDALLIDGGANHVACVEKVLQEMDITVPAFGMVKDDRHRTRGLVTSANEELGLTSNPALFAFVGRIQEETHRFAIEFHRKKQAAHVRGSALQEINGVGEARRKALMQRFGTLTAIRNATLEELQGTVPAPVAEAIYTYFHPQEESE